MATRAALECSGARAGGHLDQGATRRHVARQSPLLQLIMKSAIVGALLLLAGVVAHIANAQSDIVPLDCMRTRRSFVHRPPVRH